MDTAVSLGDWLQVLAIVGTVGVTIWVVGRWFGRTDAVVKTTVDQLTKIENALHDARLENSSEHARIVSHIASHPVHSIVQQHGERIARIESKIEEKIAGG